MQRNLLIEAKKHIQSNRRHRAWQKVVRVMAGCVVFCTTYALILPAITMEQEAFCGYEEHTHSEDCYVRTSPSLKLTCSPDELELHVHSERCLDADGNIVCGLADYVAHTHTADCVDENGVVVCAFPEIGQHVHDSSCYSAPETTAQSHTHSDSCYIKEKGELICTTVQQEAHTHTDACYAAEKALVCTTPESAGHAHSDSCYTAENVLTCTTAESAGHTHAAECYDAEGTLVCTANESAGHAHGDGCYTAQKKLICGQAEQEAHTHGDNCYETPIICGLIETTGHTHTDACYAWKETLICGLEETPIPEPELICTVPIAKAHVHSADCFDIAEEPLTCQLEESEEHTHTALCYGTWKLICPKEEHTHELACFSDPEADLETAQVWERTFKDVELTGVWADDVLAIAKTQLGYAESTRNYEVWEDGTTHGYTRYGDWFGSPYGDWCAMFVSFCIHYAEIDGVPLNWGCRTWIEELSKDELDLYREAGEYDPKPGDIIFFDWEDENGDSDDLADHVGLVAELIPATGTEPAKIKTIEGNSSNQVKYNKYDADDTEILGYGIMPENPELKAEEETVTVTALYTYSDDNVYVEVQLPEDTTVPADAVLTVTPIASDDDSYDGYVAQAEEAVDGTVANIALYDISFYTADGTYIPVSDTAKVTMGFVESPVDAEAEIQILHFKEEEAAPQIIEEVTLEEKELEMILADVQQAPESTAEVEAEQAQIAPVSGEAAESAPAEIPQSEAPAASAFSLGRSVEEAEEETEALTETEAAQQTDPTEETESAAETAPVVETVTEVRTVIQFTTDGFSTFAVVEVQTAGYTTNILLSSAHTTDLDGKILMISTADGYKVGDNGDANDHYAMSSNASSNQRAAVKAVRDGDNTVTVSPADATVALQWKFIANTDTDEKNDYYIQSVATEQYLQLGGNGSNNVNLVNEDKRQAYYVIQAPGFSVNYMITTDATLTGNTQRNETNGRELSFNYEGPSFATYGTSVSNDEAGNAYYRARLILSEFASDDTVVGLNGEYVIAGVNFNDNAADPTIRVMTSSVGAGNTLVGISDSVNADKTYVTDNTGMIWTFENTDTAGSYYIKCGGQYLNISNTGLTLSDTKLPIEVVKGVVKNNDFSYKDVVCLRVLVDGKYCYVNVAENRLRSNFGTYGAANNSVTKLDDNLLSATTTTFDKFTESNFATFESADGVNTITIPGQGDPNTWSNQLMYTGFTLENGATYQLSFEAYATTPRSIWVCAQENGNDYTPYYGEQTVALTETPQVFSYTFEMNSATDQNCKFYFGLGNTAAAGTNGTEHTVSISNVSLQKVTTNIEGRDTSTADAGNHLLLLKRKVEITEYALKATVVSRENLRNSARMPGAQIVIFVRQIDANNVARYYAVNADGSATEIYLEGDTLAEGSVIYSSTDSANMRWDATGTPNVTANGDWNGSNDVNGAIDLLAKNLGQELFLTPNMDGGYGGNNKNENQPNYRNLSNTQSITSMIESAENGSPWFNTENRRGSPLRANHNSSFRKITGNNNLGLNLDIASTIVSDLSYGDNDTTRTYASCQIFYENGGFVAKGSDGYDQADNADDSIAFYVALVDTSNLIEEEISDKTNVVGQILTREEFQDAAAEYGADYPFMIIASDGTNYYALDAYGVAQPVEFIKDNSLKAGGRFIFQTSKANMTGYEAGKTYNPNRILWDPTGTKFDSFPENTPGVGWVDMWLSNLATKQYLSPNANGLTASIPVEGEHSPGFFNVDEKNDGLASYLASRLGTLGANGTTADIDAQKYHVKLSDDASQFNVVNGWSDEGAGTLDDLNDNNAKLVFYVAMLVDWDVTYNDDTNTVAEYEPVPGVAENVKMYVFNYGSDIDYYGQRYNGTTYGDTDRIYRFFHRIPFTGQAIDGTNENDGEYALADVFNLNGNGLVFGKTLLNGAPYIDLTASGANEATTTTYPGQYSLGYLFDTTNGFIGSNEPLTLSENNGGWKVIQNEDDTVAINSDNGATPIAGGYDPVNNPNYAFKRFEVINNGEGTGLFQIDRTTGNYYYDSAWNAAWYNPARQKMELYNYALVPSGSLWCIGGNLIPFNLGNTDARRVETGAGWQNGWQGKHTEYGYNARSYQLNGFQHDDDPTIGRDSMTDLWMGMYMEIEFTMTADGTVIPKNSQGNVIGDGTPEDMVFDFQGDDDVLVYIDDVLVLDISGIHDALTGNINFRYGAVHSGNHGDTTLKKCFDDAGMGNLIDPATGLLYPWTTHTLKFFYLERGGNISNCRISYNLDYIPTGDLSITKNVVGVDAGETYSGEYNFQLDITKLGDMSDFTGTKYPISYEIRDAADNIVKDVMIFEDASKKASADIIQAIKDQPITLQANQTVYFHGLPEGTTLTVTELAASAGQPIQSVVFSNQNGDKINTEGSLKTGEIEIKSTDPQNSMITCTNTLQDVELIIEKELLDASGNPVTDENKKFQFNVTVTKLDGNTETQTVNVSAGKYETITVPFGSSVTVAETEASAAGYNNYYALYSHYEAEDGVLSNKASVNNADASGDAYVGNIKGSSQTVTIPVNSANAGDYLMNIVYGTWSNRNYVITTSAGDSITLNNLNSGNWTQWAETSTGVTLTEDLNTITFGGTDDADAPNLDYIDIVWQGKTAGREVYWSDVKDPVTFHFTNSPGYELPETGGTGTYLYTLGGLLLTAAAILMYNLINKRRKEELASS